MWRQIMFAQPYLSAIKLGRVNSTIDWTMKELLGTKVQVNDND